MFLFYYFFYLNDFHGRIIKWTQHVSFLTLAEMARSVARTLYLLQFGEI